MEEVFLATTRAKIMRHHRLSTLDLAYFMLVEHAFEGQAVDSRTKRLWKYLLQRILEHPADFSCLVIAV